MISKSLLAIHRWLGISFGVFLLIIGGSGSLLVYRAEIDRVLYPQLYHPAKPGVRLPYDSLYSRLFSRYGEDYNSVSFDLPKSEDAPMEFTLAGNDLSAFSRSRYLVDMHPTTGAVLREGDCRNVSTSFTHWTMYLHDTLQLGTAGMLIVAISALVMFVAFLTGILYYGKRTLLIYSFRTSMRATGRGQIFRATHAYIAFWTLPFTLVVFFTGFWMISGVFDTRKWDPAPVVRHARLMVSIDSCIAKSSSVLPGFIPDFVELPFVTGEPIVIDGNLDEKSFFPGGDASSVHFDPLSGAVVNVSDERLAAFPDNLSPARWGLHVGNFGGALVKGLYAIGGLVPGILWITGFIVWTRRQGGSKSAAESGASRRHTSD